MHLTVEYIAIHFGFDINVSDFCKSRSLNQDRL